MKVSDAFKKCIFYRFSNKILEQNLEVTSEGNAVYLSLFLAPTPFVESWELDNPPIRQSDKTPWKPIHFAEYGHNNPFSSNASRSKTNDCVYCLQAERLFMNVARVIEIKHRFITQVHISFNDLFERLQLIICPMLSRTFHNQADKVMLLGCEGHGFEIYRRSRSSLGSLPLAASSSWTWHAALFHQWRK